ncbi:MAG TPA: EF-hand domain-containing protein [Chthoniobacter sp.]|nr:EF-hand domain-containing protein [Chthoniobacter sp.]
MKMITMTATLSLPLASICAGMLAVSATAVRGQDRSADLAAPAAQVQKETSKKAAAPAKVDLGYLFQQLDVNNDGKLSLEEFKSLSTMVATLVADPEQAKNGKTKSTDVTVSAGTVTGLNDPAALFRRLDANGDGKLTLEEFKKVAPALGISPGHNEKPTGANGVEEKKKTEADKGTNLPDVGTGGSSSGARDSGTSR